MVEAVSFPRVPALSAERGEAVPEAGQTGSALPLAFGRVAQVVATFCSESSGSAGPRLGEEEDGCAALRSQQPSQHLLGCLPVTFILVPEACVVKFSQRLPGDLALISDLDPSFAVSV